MIEGQTHDNVEVQAAALDLTITGLHSCVIGPVCGHADGYDCKKLSFLEDPITIAYGVGDEMLHLIDCPGCDPEATGGWPCHHDSCTDIIMTPEGCEACMVAMYESMYHVL